MGIAREVPKFPFLIGCAPVFEAGEDPMDTDTMRSGDVTCLLERWAEGDQDALDALVPVVYDELHRMAARYMRRERSEHTLQTTSLVNEAYLRLREQRRVSWQCRAHFFGVAATLMRRILLRNAESAHAEKRGGGQERLPLDDAMAWSTGASEEMISLSGALDKLAAFDPRQARIVELRFFLGATIREIAELLDVSVSTVKREWRLARAWLECQLVDGAPPLEAVSEARPQ